MWTSRWRRTLSWSLLTLAPAWPARAQNPTADRLAADAYGRRAVPPGVWGPPGTLDMTGALTKAFAWDLDRRGRGEGLPVSGIAFDAHDVQPGVVFERNGVRVTSFLVDHGGLLQPA